MGAVGTSSVPPSVSRQRLARSSLTRDAVIDRAICLLDREGADAVSLRRLASDLGCGVASLYSHIDGRTQLLDLALDRVLGELDLHTGGSESWQSSLRYFGREMYVVFLNHRWAAGYMILTPHRGPAALRGWEFMASELVSGGFSHSEALDAVATLMAYILGSAAQEASRPGATASVTADRARQLKAGGDRLRRLDPALLPTLVASAEAFETQDQTTQFLVGLDTVLAGLAQGERNT